MSEQIPGMPKFCKAEGCDEMVRVNDFCQKHLYSQKLYGDPLKLIKPRLWLTRFKSDNLCSVRLPAGLECQLATMLRRLPAKKAGQPLGKRPKLHEYRSKR
jgi:hypothetical protein